MPNDVIPIDNEPLRDAPYRVLWSERIEEAGKRRWRGERDERAVTVEPVPMEAIAAALDGSHPSRAAFGLRAVVPGDCARPGSVVWFRVERSDGTGGDVLRAQSHPHGGARNPAHNVAAVIARRRADAARGPEHPLAVAQRYSAARAALSKWILR